MDLALNNLQRLICHKTQQTKPFFTIHNLKYHIVSNILTYKGCRVGFSAYTSVCESAFNIHAPCLYWVNPLKTPINILGTLFISTKYSCPEQNLISSTVSSVCRIHRLHLCRRVRPPQ